MLRESQQPGRLPGLAILFAAALAIVAMPAGATAAEPAGPGTTVSQAVDQAVAILHDTSMPVEQRRRALHDLASSHFDFADMARSALGYHWHNLSEDQRAEFTGLFAAFLEDAYLDRIQDYSDLQVKVTGEQTDGAGYARVGTRMVRPEQEPIAVTFSLKLEDRDWKVYDLAFDSISVVANYRNQLSRVINNQGFPALMSKLRQKQAELAALLGTSKAAEQQPRANGAGLASQRD